MVQRFRDEHIQYDGVEDWVVINESHPDISILIIEVIQSWVFYKENGVLRKSIFPECILQEANIVQKIVTDEDHCQSFKVLHYHRREMETKYFKGRGE